MKSESCLKDNFNHVGAERGVAKTKIEMGP